MNKENKDRAVQEWLDGLTKEAESTLRYFNESFSTNVAFAVEYYGEEALEAGIWIDEIKRIKEMINMQGDFSIYQHADMEQNNVYEMIVRWYQGCLMHNAQYSGKNTQSVMGNLAYKLNSRVYASIINKMSELTQ